jgi:hypothetical protein
MSWLHRYVVAPTVTMLAVMKARLTGATKGHALLKKKADALTMRFRCVHTRAAAEAAILPSQHRPPTCVVFAKQKVPEQLHVRPECRPRSPP